MKRRYWRHNMKHVKSVSWAHKQWKEGGVLFVDCRFHLDNPDQGRREYEEEHLPGAIYFDLEKDLSGEVEKNTGRHPLPYINTFLQKLTDAGISNDTVVIAYDDQKSAMASRFWWLLSYLGHTNVYVLNGGFGYWKFKEFPTDCEQEVKLEKQSFHPTIHRELVADQSYVKQQLQKKGVAIIDSRSYERYAGWKEPIDPVAGHIPGAAHYDWTTLFNTDGCWKTSETLRQHYHEIQGYQEIIVYCGSGVTAIPNVIGLYEAGYMNVRLYVGSWSDWITNSENPVHTICKKN